MAPSKDQIEKSTIQIANRLDRRADRDMQRMRNAIGELEKRIIAESRKLQTKGDGTLVSPRVNLKQAQKLHTSMSVMFEELYGQEITQHVRGYEDVADWVIEGFTDFDIAADFTDADRVLIDQLNNQTIIEFTTLGNQARERIAQSLYNSIAAQAPYDSLVNTISASLTGKLSTSGVPLSTYAETYANDAIMNFYNSVHVSKGQSLGMQWFYYAGTAMARTRDFCLRRMGRAYSIEEINSWNDESWSGKRGPALQYRGGWNCRHHWRAVKKEWVDRYNLAEDPGDFIEAPKGWGDKVPWSSFSKADQSKINTLTRKIKRGGHTFTEKLKRVQWFHNDLSAEQREAILTAWRNQGLDIPEAFLKGIPAGATTAVAKKTSKKVPKAKKAEKKIPKVKKRSRKAILEDLDIHHEEMTKLDADEIEELGLHEAVYELEIELYHASNPSQRKRMREELVDSMLMYVPAGKTDPKRIVYKGTRHIPYRLLKDMTRRDLRIVYHDYFGRAGFSASISGEARISLYSNGNPITVAHETGHAVDAFMAGGGQRFSQSGMGYWTDSIYSTADEARQYRRWYDKQTTGQIGIYSNGDGEFDIGNFIHDYEGRRYPGGGKAEQFFSMCSQRYATAYQTFSTDRFDKAAERRINDLKEAIALSKKQPMTPTRRRTIIRRQEEVENFLKGGSYEERKWEWSIVNSYEWNQQRIHYPEFAKWYEDFMSRVDGISPLKSKEIKHKAKKKTLQLFKEYENIQSEIKDII